MNSTRRFRTFRNKLASLRQTIGGKCELMAVGLVVVACMAQPAVGQTEPETGDTVTVTGDSGTWLQQGPVNAITISKGAAGVTIDNGTGGVITSDNASAIETSANTTINNSGNISGGFNGVDFRNGAGSGVLNNGTTGTISSDSRAVNIGGSVDLTNAGQILGTGDQRNGTIYSDSAANNFSINNSGTIDAGRGNLGAGFSAELSASGTDFTIDNSGDIIGRGDAGAGLATAGDGIRLERTRVGGALDGSTTGLFTGEINNSGTITSEGANGTVGGFRAVNGVSFQGTLNNEGTISGTQNGVYFGNAVGAGGADHTGGVVNNSGTISSDSRAFNIDGTGLEVDNSGEILGTGDQRNGTVYADSTAQDFTLNNSGTIDTGRGNQGAAFSTELSEAGNNFTIDNSGDIVGRGDAGAGLATAGDGIRLERTRVGGALDGSTTGLFTGEINNSGTITSEGANGTVGGFRAVNGVSFQGTLNNEGTISGTQNGVYFGNAVGAGGADHTGGVVNNSGTISSDSRAFNIDGNGLLLNNTGNILATGRQRNGTVYADGTANNFTILNSGAIDARRGAGSGISVQVGSVIGDIQNGSIINSGVIFGSGDQAFDAGIRFFSPASDTIFSGDIVNAEGGFIGSTGDAAAVLFDSDVRFDGALENFGAIDGSILLSDGDLILGETSVLSLEISSLTDFDVIETTGSIFANGILDIAFGEGFLPSVGQSFDLFDFGTINGEFDLIQSGGIQLDTSDLFIGGSVSIAAVPEPSTFAVLGLSALFFTGRRRRLV